MNGLHLLLSALLLAPPAPPATPTAAAAREKALPLVGALESAQGEGRERVALFGDGTLVLSTSFRGRTNQKRKLLSEEEVLVLKGIAAEAADVDGRVEPSGVLSVASERSVILEVVSASGTARTFRFDDLSSLPLAVGRARGAFEDLRSRFLEKDVSKEEEWDPSGVVEGTLLKRRTDGLLFRVTRDDRFERGVELAEESRQLERMFVLREALPKLFVAPAGLRPAPTPTP